MISTTRLASLATLLSLPLLAQQAPNPVLRWNEFALLTIQQTAANPPIATRVLAMTHTAMFDAWAAYDDFAVGVTPGAPRRLPPELRTPANKEIAISHAAYRVLLDLFPTRKPALDAFALSLGLDLSSTAGPAAVGNAAAAALLEFRHRDGSNQLGDLHPGAYSDYTGYSPDLSNPDRWQPLPTPSGAPQQWLLPHWGLVQGFALESGDQFRPGPQPRHGGDLFDSRCVELIHLTANLSDREKMIAEYWEDGPGTVTPPGHWNRIAQFVSRRDGNSLDRDVKLFFALTNAQFDAGIATWEAKRFYDSPRPITAIRRAFAGRLISGWAGPGLGARTIPGDQWTPYLPTPPFGEYTSGHSAFSSSSAEILRQFTGSDDYDDAVIFAPGTSRIEPGVTPRQHIRLYWATFSDAADEAGISRRFGGIHFEEGDLRARTLGRQVGFQAWRKALAHIQGDVARR
jgi:hypothetical protein